ncbi:hypothetical protein P9246_17680 [Aeribacillus pallidus]|jgi:hypothetical protein|uniref:Uncharacterized protein n=1 Tax=Aeribacillus phage AP45 TaxID=1913112 RepID=A0A1L2JZ24_9CAUD|nr:hypothetical protein HWD36_gp02 [Aeribacillus phage AP45]APC46451.1 hypothetical protein [Aeribacillus phage AP45]MED0649741.1 hypothetical protein [Aeribacillus composti]MED4488544.1 hypothetical protein [Aeribacillus pallidus]
MSEVKYLHADNIHILNQTEHEELKKLPEDLKRILNDPTKKNPDGFISNGYCIKFNKEAVYDIQPFDIHFDIDESTHRGVEKHMNNNDNFNLLFTELKQDMREREERTRKEITEREKRFEKQMEKFSSEAKERELRIEKIVSDAIQSVNKEVMELKGEMKNITQRVDSIHSRVDSLKYFIIGSVVTLLIGIAGIVYANWQVISSMLQLANNK